MSSLPFFKFFCGDWLKNPDLKRCSHAAKGVLVDMLCLCFQMEERGVFISNGKPWSSKQIAQVVGGDTGVVEEAILELLEAGMLKKRRDGAIYSSRMVRDEDLRRKRASGGRFGGNPSLAKVNLPNNHPPNLKSESELESESLRSLGKGEGEGETRGLRVPEKLTTPSFAKAWSEWVAYRVSLGRCKNFAVMLQKQLDWLAEYPERTACAILEQSIRHGWQGLFEVKDHHVNGNANGHKSLSIHELKTVAQAKLNKAAEMKRKYCSEVAMGETWNDEVKRKEYFKIKREVREIEERISAFA